MSNEIEGIKLISKSGYVYVGYTYTQEIEEDEKNNLMGIKANPVSLEVNRMAFDIREVESVVESLGNDEKNIIVAFKSGGLANVLGVDYDSFVVVWEYVTR